MVFILTGPILFLLIFAGVLYEWRKEIKLKSIYHLMFGLLVPYIITIPAFMLGLDDEHGIFFILMMIGLLVSVPGLIVLGIRMFFLQGYREKIVGIFCLTFATLVLIMAYEIVSDPGFI